MGVFWIILWAFALLGLLRMAVPSDMMRRDPAGSESYFLLWGGMMAGTMAVMYLLMKGTGMGGPFIITSTLVAAVYFTWRVAVRPLILHLLDEGDDRRHGQDEPCPPPVDSPASEDQTANPTCRRFSGNQHRLNGAGDANAVALSHLNVAVMGGTANNKGQAMEERNV